jgi:hypothetical protein
MMPSTTTFSPTRCAPGCAPACAPGSSRVNHLKNEIPVQSFGSGRVMNRQLIWKVVCVIVLVCGLQLYGQQTASGAQGRITISDDPAAGTGPSQGTFPTAINPAGAITGYYLDQNNVCGTRTVRLTVPSPPSMAPRAPNTPYPIASTGRE